MIVALGVCQKDVQQAQDLLDWISHLDKQLDYECVIVADADTDYDCCRNLLEQARTVFRGASLVATNKSVKGWPKGSNALFQCTAEYVSIVIKEPFLWLEPDAIPLKSGWLKAIDDAYKACKKPFFGRVYEQANDPLLPKRLLSGIAVYPSHTHEFIGNLVNGEKAWDVAIAEKVLPHSASTGLIQWFWGKPDMAPTFAPTKEADSPINTFTKSNLEPDAVLFHRNKDGTLIDLLRGNPPKVTDGFVVVLPFFRNDAARMLSNVEWMVSLRTPRTHDALLWYEFGTDQGTVARMAMAARRSFRSVKAIPYQTSIRGPNGAWTEAAKYMAGLARSWLWVESDAIPLRSNWLSVLQDRYSRKGKPFMGPVIPHMGHMNGTAVYPAHTPTLCARTMATKQLTGWDCIMKSEMEHLCHNCIDIFQHAWIEQNGQLMPYGDGHLPTFPHQASLNRLLPSAVIFHRNKDHTLISRLRERGIK